MYAPQGFALLTLLCGTTVSLSANEKLIRCCHGDPEIDQYCAEKFCRIPMIQSVNVFPFISECSPRGRTVQKIWDCVSSRHDHTKCCSNQGVLSLCMPYCNAVGAVPTDMAKYGICIGEFEKFRVCFRSYLQHHPSIRGDN